MSVGGYKIRNQIGLDVKSLVANTQAWLQTKDRGGVSYTYNSTYNTVTVGYALPSFTVTATSTAK